MRTLLFIALLGTSSALAADAQSAFEAKNYSSAIHQTELQLATAPTAEGYYNVGLANEKAGDLVLASMNYHRALMLDPGLSVARNALAKLAASKSIPLPPNTWINDVNAFVHPDLLVMTGAILLWAGAFGLLFATQAESRRAVWNALSALGLIFGFAALSAGWLTDARMMLKEPALVTSKDGAEVLTAPSNNSNPLISLPPGTAVDVLSPRGAWSYVDLNGGVRGWVLTERLTPVVPGENL